MNVPSTSQTSSHETAYVDNKHERLLRRVLRANAGFSGLSGLVSLLGANVLTTFTGISNALVFQVLGVILLLYAADLFWITFRDRINPWFGITAVVLDIIWVAGSAIFLLGDFIPLTAAGKWSILLIAEIVSIFAMIQGYAVWKMQQDENLS